MNISRRSCKDDDDNDDAGTDDENMENSSMTVDCYGKREMFLIDAKYQ